jgi:hypothetical protein
MATFFGAAGRVKPPGQRRISEARKCWRRVPRGSAARAGISCPIAIAWKAVAALLGVSIPVLIYLGTRTWAAMTVESRKVA